MLPKPEILNPKGASHPAWQALDDVDIKFRVANVRSAATEAALASLSVAESPAQRRPQRTSEYSVAQKAGLGEMVAKLGLSPAGAAPAPCSTFYVIFSLLIYLNSNTARTCGLTLRVFLPIAHSWRRVPETRVCLTSSQDLQ